MFYDFRESHICLIHDQLRNKIRSIKLTALFIQCVLENIYFTNYSLCNFKFRATEHRKGFVSLSKCILKFSKDNIPIE